MNTSPFAHENTPASAYGEFEPMGQMTDEDWAEYDAYIAAEIAEFDATMADEADFYVDLDPEPPF